ncbi:MAG: 16S rRNA (adenine(1518)-N(6)/adenine(1519)-N(6))-dimethyltransferase RsmA [Oscillospiraceae bacterium]|nr:16S rRNA (adenine(1518)-N(6)/adenine(1519)-N(6))-dimethyltransferase RsmA [Oscillospiraceae bacterium]
MDLSDINIIKRLLKKHGFSFSKALGQNFIVDPGVCPQMAELSGINENSGVIEIGAGIGVLTKELAERAKKVVSFELDRRLLPVLGETLAGYGNAFIINEDILKTDPARLINEEFGGMDVYVCANLPYYITSPVIMLLLESRLPLESITVMVQKEAALRLTAHVGSRESGAVTVAVDYYADAEMLFSVGREAFFPRPKVASAVIKLAVSKTPKYSPADEKLFFALVKAAFAQRRKTAVNAISAGLGIPKEKIADALLNMGLGADIRAEKIRMDDLIKLSNFII